MDAVGQGSGFPFFPVNFHKHLQHVSHIHNCTPGLVLLYCINNMHCKEKVYDYIFNG